MSNDYEKQFISNINSIAISNTNNVRSLFIWCQCECKNYAIVYKKLVYSVQNLEHSV